MLVRCGIGYVDVAPGQVDVPLADRVRVANSAKADIYVSIHYNAYDGKWDSTKGGIETYHYQQREGQAPCPSDTQTLNQGYLKCPTVASKKPTSMC